MVGRTTQAGRDHRRSGADEAGDAGAGLTDQTRGPPAGHYDREGNRNFSMAYETAQTPLQMAALPSADEVHGALMRASEASLAAGCYRLSGRPRLRLLPGSCRAGRLKLRIYALAVNSLQHPVTGVLAAGYAAVLVTSG
jgi:hypothetical protein